MVGIFLNDPLQIVLCLLQSIALKMQQCLLKTLYQKRRLTSKAVLGPTDLER